MVEFFVAVLARMFGWCWVARHSKPVLLGWFDEMCKEEKLVCEKDGCDLYALAVRVLTQYSRESEKLLSSM
jgi:hypothetical protein